MNVERLCFFGLVALESHRADCKLMMFLLVEDPRMLSRRAIQFNPAMQCEK
jgi:hypothetical protein